MECLLYLSKDTLGRAFVIISASMFSVRHYVAIHLFSNEMKGHIDMFCAVVEFWISGKFHRSLIVLRNCQWNIFLQANIRKQSSEPNYFLTCCTQSNLSCSGGRSRNRCLPFTAPTNRVVMYQEHIFRC